MIILNLTQHIATEDQVAAGVVDLPEYFRGHLTELLTFDTIPTAGTLVSRAQDIVHLANEWWWKNDPDVKEEWRVMIGGAPWFMGPLIKEFRWGDIGLLFAFSARECIDEPQPDGSVRKISTFKHAGFIEVDP